MNGKRLVILSSRFLSGIIIVLAKSVFYSSAGRDGFNIVIDMNSKISLCVGLIVLGLIPIFANIYPCRCLGILFKFRNGQFDSAVITSASGKNGLKPFQ